MVVSCGAQWLMGWWAAPSGFLPLKARSMAPTIPSGENTMTAISAAPKMALLWVAY